MKNSTLFFNRCFDKKRLKNFILWFFNKYGGGETIHLIENLKKIGFQYATEAGISIGIDDLQIPYIKSDCIGATEQKIQNIEISYQKGDLTDFERQQQFVDEWSFISEKLKRHVIQFFKATDVFNPIYMMAFSGARGNISQIRQLIGMRGLMADPQGQILNFPIRSNFREGLTLTEYLISCYGARKGVVDTALRTATSGYLTRRLVDVTQQVVIGRQDCQTTRGVYFTNLMDGDKILLPLKERLTGRILLKDIFITHPFTKNKNKVYFKNQEISSLLASKIHSLNNQILLRSPLTCSSKNSICQLCYGWNLAYNAVVSIGEAVGVLAAQSIGEPGTQLTMRTFHTGGVFTGGIVDQIYAPFDGKIKYLNSLKGTLIRTLKGKIGFLTKTEGFLQVKNIKSIKLTLKESHYRNKFDGLLFSTQLKNELKKQKNIYPLLRNIWSMEIKLKKIKSTPRSALTFSVPIHTILFSKNGNFVVEKELIAELTSSSILENQSQETEHEVLAPLSGQVSFENLNLIEKTKRDGSIQKIAYGIGSIWVAGADCWKSSIFSSIFPVYGDFVNHSSAVQKIQILIEKSYYLNARFLKSVQNFQKTKTYPFSVERLAKKILDKSSLNTLFFKKDCYFIQLQKISYKNFRYFALANFRNWFFYINFTKYKRLNFLCFRDNFIKNIHLKLELNIQTLGLNFSFNRDSQNLLFQKLKSKSIFWFYIKKKYCPNLSREFFLIIFFPTKTNKKIRKSLNSKKYFKPLRSYNYRHWGSFNLLRELIGLNFSPWKFFLNKKKKTIIKRNKSFLRSKKIKSKSHKLNTLNFNHYLIFKNFIHYQYYDSLLLSTNLPIFFKLEQKYNWLSIQQTNFILLNRQSFFSLQLPKSWFLINLLETKSFFETKFHLNFFDRYKLRFCLFNLKLTHKPTPKLILINPKWLTSYYHNPAYLKLYLIQNFLIFFYQDYFLNSKLRSSISELFYKKNIKIGFQTQIRLNIFPFFVKHIRKEINLPYKNKQIFLKNYKSQCFENDLCGNLKKMQTFKSWVCLCNSQKFFKIFGIILNLELKNKVCFEQQKVMVDYICHKNILKLKLKKIFFYKHFFNKNLRFSFSYNFSEKLILFQKIKNYLKPENHFSKILNINFVKYKFQNNLIFNSLKNYFHSFKIKPLKPKNLFNLIFFSSYFSNSTKRIYQKSEFFINQPIKIKNIHNSNYRLSFNPYFELNQKPQSFFIFNRTGRLKNGINYYNFNFLNSLSFKAFNLTSVQKLDFQEILLKANKKESLLQIFYKNFNSLSIKNLIFIKFFNPVEEGEIIYTKFEKKKTKTNFLTLSRSNLIAFQLENKKILLNSNFLKLGEFIRHGTGLKNNEAITLNGQTVYVDKGKLIIRKATPFLIPSKSLLNVYQDKIIEKGAQLLTFPSYKVKTGDIIQGIPKIEEFFEARLTREGSPLAVNLHIQIKQLFKDYSLKYSNFEATNRSFEKIQSLIIDEIQKVYCSQGIYIADKHLEIVIRQMTSKVQILKGGRTGLLCGELIEFDWAHLIEQKFAKEEIIYEPVVLGITKSCLETESFISAASFQETTRILAKAAIQNKIDFVRGLKQNVILGNLIPAGTGLFPQIYLKYS